MKIISDDTPEFCLLPLARRKRLLLRGLLILLTGLAVTSCHHKDLVYESGLRTDLEVVYDWRNAPDADPASMELRLHPENDPAQVVNFFFQNRTGGHLDAPVGDYTAVTLNGDLTDWAYVRNHEDADLFQIYTGDADALQNTGFSTRGVPRAEGSESERVALAPGMVWADRKDGIGIHNTPGKHVITFYPEELVCHYTVDIYDVDHMEYLEQPRLDATLCGMAEGVYPGRKISSENAVTVPFTLAADAQERSLHGEFLTFGESDGQQRPHSITVYLTLTDGSRRYVTADVGEQIYKAQDPHHVHIVLRGLDLPQPINSMGGFVPDVDEWQPIYIDLKM